MSPPLHSTAQAASVDLPPGPAPADVDLRAVPLDGLEPLAGPGRTAELRSLAAHVKRRLAGRAVWNVNSTATGGGVAELLDGLLGYVLGAGIDVRWTVVQADEAFFDFTKRVHNWLHGAVGDGEGLDGDGNYDAVLAANARALASRVRPGDVVVLHDPQTAGLVRDLADAGAGVVWRCHTGADRQDDHVRRAWDFLRPRLDAASAFVFSSGRYVPTWMDPDRVRVIAPSIDPFATKNIELSDDVVHAVLARAGIVEGNPRAEPVFTARDGSRHRVKRACAVVRESGAVPYGAPLVAQVSRWDRLKDMVGVLHGFARGIDDEDVHLALVGPAVRGVADDPEGQEVYEECVAAWRRLSDSRRRRVHLVSVPMDDVEENAAIINAVQRHAAVVVQKSLAEGFGLTVSEAMWKGRPVLASAVGGIRDQIVDGEHGVLLGSPRDLDDFSARLTRLLRDPGEGRRLGENARRRVITQYLGDRQLIEWGHLLEDLLC